MWEKRGLIYCPTGENTWQNNSVLTPTPFLLDEETIRVYAAFRDKEGQGRIGYVDVEAKNPSKIIKISKDPVLDLGAPGCFDDNGVILGDVIRHDGKIYMYYVGFQLVKKIKFMAFVGLAISEDGGNTFVRKQSTPILDRAENAVYIRAIHTVLVENGVFRIWYAVGNGWERIDGVDYPQYDIRYMESPDGITFPDNDGVSCLTVGENEYRIGRPRVRRIGDKYEMRFTYDTMQKEYKTGIAHSTDGVNWTRLPEPDIFPSETGWDSREVCYPVILETKYGTYMFYDGNGMGAEGFGYAKEITP